MLSLSSFAGSNIYIAFHNVSVDEFILKVDDIKIGNQPTHDIGISGVEGVEIFDISGRLALRLLEDENTVESPYTFPPSDYQNHSTCSYSPATHEFTWIPSTSITSGVYLVRAQTTNGQTVSKCIIYLK
ncbi:hypothetical protein KAH81_03775 [bacterium]|nr:hypothetical protein [bacterium]